MRQIDELKIDKSFIEVVDMKTADDAKTDLEYWLSRPPLERIEGIEAMRQCFYSYDPSTERSPRIFEVIDQA